MSKYWSNEDDKKVSYVTEQPLRTPRVKSNAREPEPGAAVQQTDGAFSYSRGLRERDDEAAYNAQYDTPVQYGADRSSFISEDANAQQRQMRQSAPPPPPQYGISAPPETAQYGSYQVHSEPPHDPRDGRRGRFWLRFFIIIVVLALIGGGAYIFRYEILDLIGNIFGEEVVWKIAPTPAPTVTASPAPAYTNITSPAIKTQALGEISAVTGDLELDTQSVTEQNIVLKTENADGTNDYYLFAYDSGRLLGYYDGLSDFIPCGNHIFYMARNPYLITSRGFPLADPAALSASAGGDVAISPMIGGWATVSDTDGSAYNLISEDGTLISKLWFNKLFPFTGDRTVAYVDTGNVTGNGDRYALYLLYQSGETKRLSYVPDTDGLMESVCGMAFTPDGEMLMLEDTMPVLMTTDDVTAYVNCGALIVRDPETGLYGLFVDGVQQYPFAFDSIGPVPSDLNWKATENGYVTRCTVDNLSYPLPRSYSFILRKGDTEQIVSIAAVSMYPIILD